jgi:hypothetical protein
MTRTRSRWREAADRVVTHVLAEFWLQERGFEPLEVFRA